MSLLATSDGPQPIGETFSAGLTVDIPMAGENDALVGDVIDKMLASLSSEMGDARDGIKARTDSGQ